MALIRRGFLLPLIAGVALSVQSVPGSYAGAAVPAWTTYRHDAARSGIDPDSTNPVTPSQAWQTPALDGEVYGQPLLYGSYVYVATENDTVYKFDAATGAVAWSEHLATPEPASVAPCGDISPSIGVTSTPVIDPAANRLYLVGAVSASGTVHHELFSLDLSSGQPTAGFPLLVDPPYPAGGAAVNQLQRAGLALDEGRIVIGYGGNDGDCSTYWGWLVSAPTDGTTQLASFQVDGGHTAGAIWAAGNAPAVDAGGDVFVATGNGIGNSTSNPQYGDSVVKLNASASPLDWWAPPNWTSLDSSDADLGSSMPTLLPGGFLFQSGKDGNGYLLNGTSLGGVGPPVATTGFCSGGSFGGSVYDPVNFTIYAACRGGLRALSFNATSPPSLAAKAGFSAPSGATGPPMIAGGLVWVTNYSSGTLYGVDPTSGATASRFTIPENREPGGSDVAHFASPSAGGGRLFVASGDQVTAYTVATPPSAPPTPTAPPPTGSAVAGGSPSVRLHSPVISHASISPRRFKSRHFTTLRLTLSEPATLTVAISELRHGHRLGHGCSSKARKGRPCLRRVTLVRLHFHARAGRNALKLSLRRLVPGHYTAVIYATDRTGRRSRSSRVTFTVLPARR
ncbi:MAG: PQQ-binding-like beta-propeller repeat protein [Solirubrobacterales bacterium]|nr:PQQ-binding-like beta-propeller repeat protein [Solirubrobacterales bacterium]